MATEIHSINTQNDIPIPLSNLKSYLKKKLIKEWCQSKSNENTMSFREIILSHKTSNLKNRINTPRQLQTLFSRYRCDRSEIVGKYPRKLKRILDPSCRLCNSCEESIYHLLDNCIGTLQYRNQHNLSINTLVTDSPTSILKISEFDEWLRNRLVFDSKPHEYRIQQGIGLIKKRKFMDETETELFQMSKRSNFLVVPDGSNAEECVVTSSKVIRIE